MAKKKMSNKEQHRADFDNIKIEIREEDGVKKIRGHAAVFDSPSKGLLWWDKREMIGRSAFKKTIKENKEIKALFNHNTDKVLGSVRAETLILETDDKGLYFEILPAEELRSYEKDLLISLKRGDITSCSFGFYPMKWHDEEVDGEMFRVIDDLKLFEISVVPFPAYEETDAGFRDEENSGGNGTIDNDEEENEERAEPGPTEEPDPTPDQPESTEEPDPTAKKRSFWENEILLLKLR